MRRTSAILSAALSTIAIAQQGEFGPNNETTPTFVEGEIVVHTVTVGYYADAFQPNSINANPGDKVMFKFYPGTTHSVIESLYGWPCVPRESVDGVQGFYSGTFPNATNEKPGIWNLTVKSASTTFYYCGAPGSCINNGMLGVINPTNETNLTGQIDLAKQSKYELPPNGTLPASAAASISALAATILANPSSTADHENKSSSGLSAGAIAGIVVGAVAVLALLGGLLFWFGRKRRSNNNNNNNKNQQPPQPPTQQENVKSPNPPTSFPPPEMTVDGVTYVPAFDSRASTQKGGFLPPYQPPQRSWSPETSHSPYSATTVAFPGQLSYNPDFARFTDSPTAFSFHSSQPRSPPPRHELPAQSIPVLQEEEDVDLRPLGLNISREDAESPVVREGGRFA